MINQEVLQKAETERQLMNTMRERQWRFVGHLLREEGGIEKHTSDVELRRTWAKGKQRIKMLDWRRKN